MAKEFFLQGFHVLDGGQFERGALRLLQADAGALVDAETGFAIRYSAETDEITADQCAWRFSPRDAGELARVGIVAPPDRWEAFGTDVFDANGLFVCSCGSAEAAAIMVADRAEHRALWLAVRAARP